MVGDLKVQSEPVTCRSLLTQQQAPSLKCLAWSFLAAKWQRRRLSQSAFHFYGKDQGARRGKRERLFRRLLSMRSQSYCFVAGWSWAAKALKNTRSQRGREIGRGRDLGLPVPSKLCPCNPKSHLLSVPQPLWSPRLFQGKDPD